MKSEYVLINSKIAPEVLLKVLEAKKLLNEGKAKTVCDAIDIVNISRSAYYKYKDYVFDYSDDGFEQIYTLFFELMDKSGVLSEILKTIARFGSNVLTINQNIPVNRLASVIISARFDNSNEFDELLNALKGIYGVNKVKLLNVQ